MAYDDVVRGAAITAFVSPGNNGELVGNVGCTIDVWEDGGFVPLAPEVIDAGFGSVSVLGVAKNPIAVGGRRKSLPLGTASFSSRGPTRDGRLKPDIVAVSGDDDSLITMPSTPETYDSDLGVSFAVPQAAGAAALLLEHYRQDDPGFHQDPAVFKAVLANTAADVGAPGPDYSTGFGELRIGEALVAADSYTMLQIAPGATELFEPNLDLTQACGLRVMAAWNDPPPMSPAMTQLVNDLDLAVFSGNGVVLPWVLTPSNPLNLATRGVNSVDNVEQVTIDDPAGDEVFRVTGTNVMQGPQEVVVHWYAVPCDRSSDDGAADGTGVGEGGDGSEPGCSCDADTPGRRGMPCLFVALVAARRRERPLHRKSVS